jgi:hypothetical protein
MLHWLWVSGAEKLLDSSVDEKSSQYRHEKEKLLKLVMWSNAQI